MLKLSMLALLLTSCTTTAPQLVTNEIDTLSMMYCIGHGGVVDNSDLTREQNDTKMYPLWTYTSNVTCKDTSSANIIVRVAEKD